MIDFNGNELEMDKEDKELCTKTLGAIQYLLARYMKMQRSVAKYGFYLSVEGTTGSQGIGCSPPMYDKLITDDAEAIVLMELLLADTEDK